MGTQENSTVGLKLVPHEEPATHAMPAGSVASAPPPLPKLSLKPTPGA
jgi:hypothetical protein